MKRFLVVLLALMMCLPAGTSLADDSSLLGSPMPDFTVVTIDGSVFSLSQALETKDLVMINLWATWCPPCRSEFPYMQKAYQKYQDRIEIIALSVEETDTAEKLTAFANQYGLTFPLGSDSETYLGYFFSVEFIPTTVIVDRFGNIAHIGVGAMSSVKDFTQLFDFFLSDQYTETTVR